MEACENESSCSGGSPQADFFRPRSVTVFKGVACKGASIHMLDRRKDRDVFDGNVRDQDHAPVIRRDGRKAG